MRSVLAVLAGMVVWAVLWISGSQVLQMALPEIQPEMPIDHVGALTLLVAYSVVLSVLAGWVTAALAARNPVAHAGVLAAIQLGIGVMVQMSAWALFPLWYHVLFLGLLVPATVYGGVRRARRPAPAAA